MREIKFRAWDGKRLFFPDVIGMTENGMGGGYGEWVSIPFQPHITLEQFTGLRDKAGREIYEGDIWKACRSVRTEPIEVSWIDGSSGFYPFTEPAQGGYEWDAEEAERGEVIGNIHESPELLK